MGDRGQLGFNAALELLLRHLQRGRLLFWGEGALSQFLMIIWFLERAGLKAPANGLLLGLIQAVAESNSRESQNPYADPYISADESLAKLFAKMQDVALPRRNVVESYSLFPMVMLAVRRDLRQQLETLWRSITDVALTWFGADAPEDFLLWRCDKGKEYSQTFAHPQSWKELQQITSRDDSARVPKVLRDDSAFALIFSLVYQHRTQLSLVKHLDSVVAEAHKS